MLLVKMELELEDALLAVPYLIGPCVMTKHSIPTTLVLRQPTKKLRTPKYA